MTAGHNFGQGGTPSRYTTRRRLLPVLAMAGAWATCLVGLAPAAQADGVRSQQWYLDAMRAEEMWKVSTGEGVKVAVIDTGVNSSTDSLRGQVLPGEDLTGAPGDATDDYGAHGTNMAEIIAGTGRNGGVRGLAPGAKIIPFRVALEDFKGEGDMAGVAKAVRAAADSDAQILSMSFSGLYDPEFDQAVKYALSKGKMLFASVGNDAEGANEQEYPASYPGVIGVGATDRKGEVMKFSQHGYNVDLAAPGDKMPGWCDSDFRKYCVKEGGTSSATAIASASAALIWAEHPDWTANQVLSVLVDTAGRKDEKKASSNYIGYGAVRPRVHLLEGKGEPGNPDENPIEATEPSPSPSTSSSSEGDGSETGDRPAEDRVEKAGSETEADNDLWIYLGAGAAAVAVVAGAFVLVRRIRRT